MTRTGAVLSIISTIVGGGIVSLPHSFYFIGIILGALFIILAAAQSTYSILLYLKAKDYLPGKPQSLYEMGFILFNRSSIFMISAVLTFTSFGLIIIYFMVFSGTFSALILDLTSICEDSFWAGKTIYVVGLSILLIPLAIKKEL